MSALVVKTVTGTLKYGDGSVWPSGLIVFEPVAVFGATPVTVPIEQIKVYSGANGTFTVDLLTFDDTAVTYDCTLPSGDTFRFNLPAGAGSTTLETLRGTAYVPTAPGYDHGVLTGLGDDDHPHYLNNTRGDARYAAIGHNHSGVYSPVGHGHTAADVSDFAATVRGTVLTGLGAGSNAAIAATDTILAAFAKLQNQISNFAAGGMDIGGTIGGSPTAGSVLFVGAGGVLAENPSKLSWDNINTILKFNNSDLASLLYGSITVIGPDAQFYIGGVNSTVYYRGRNYMSAAYASYTPLEIQLASSQSVDALRIKDFAGNTYFQIEPPGYGYGIRIRGNWGPDGVVLNEGGLSFTDTGYGVNLFIAVNYANLGPRIYSNSRPLTLAYNAGTFAARFDGDITAGNTRLEVYDVDNGQLERVSVGAADSGGTGYKVLRIPN